MEKLPVGLELRSLSNLIRRYFEFSSHRKEIDTITGNNGWIIGYLSRNAGRDVYPKDLEEHFSITRSTVSKVLGLTEKAKQVEGLMRDDAARLERTLAEGFSEEELQTLYSYIERMKKNISQIQKGRSGKIHD